MACRSCAACGVCVLLLVVGGSAGWGTDGQVVSENPLDDWQPNISTAQVLSNRSLVITVEPIVGGIHYLQVCVSKASSIPCLGKVYPQESPQSTLRYRVEGLPGNQSYYVYIRPFDKNDKKMDMWIHKRDAIFLEPWPEGKTTTWKPPDTTSLPPPKDSHGGGLERGVFVVLVLVFLITILTMLAICLLWRKGYLQKIRFIATCLPQSPLVGPPIKVIQLYVPESEQFQRVVRKHMEYLSQYLNLDSLDCTAMNEQTNPDHWLEQECETRRILFYVSQELMMELQRHKTGWPREDVTRPNVLAKKCVSIICRRADPVVLSRGRGRGRNPIFILSGCFPCDRQFPEYLRHHRGLDSLPHYSISNGGRLVEQVPLLTKLSGCHSSFFPSSHGSGTTQATELSHAIHSLREEDCTSNFYVDVGELNRDMESMRMMGNGHVGFEPPCTQGGRAGQHPHRTDSGFSSDHPQLGSNPSSEGNSSPGDHCGEGERETDPMLQYRVHPMLMNQAMDLSASQDAFSFLPPESVAGDSDSLVLEDLRRFNDRADWSNAK